MAKYYRYRTLTHSTFSEIQNSEIFFTKVSLLNDPLEGKKNIIIGSSKNKFLSELNKITSPNIVSKIKLFLRSSITLENLLQTIQNQNYFIDNNQFSEFKNKIHNLFDFRYNIVSFSKNNNNPVMWGAYADKHKGICIEYDDFEHNYFEFQDNSRHKVYKVKYLSKPHNFYVKDIFNENSKINIFTKKYKDWKYEQEFRLIRNAKPTANENTLHILPKHITKIIMGKSITEDNENNLRSILKEKNKEHIIISRAIEETSKYEIIHNS